MNANGTMGRVAGTCCGDMLRGHVAGTCCGDVLPEHVAGTRSRTCCNDSYPCVTCPYLRKGSVAGTK